MDTTVDNVKLIVKKHGATLTDSTKGSVDILFVVSKTELGEECHLPSDGFFTKGVFISNDYQDIESKFKNEELFTITCKDNDDFNPDDPQGRHDKWALGGWAKPLANSEYLPIVNAELPDVSTGQINKQTLSVDVRMSPKPFFINSEGFLYGPLVISKTEGELSTLVQYPQTVISLSTDMLMKLDLNKLKEHSGVLVTTENRKSYITSLRDLSRFHIGDSVRHDDKDFISDEKLIDYYSRYKLGRKSSILSKKEANNLKQGLLDWTKKTESLKDNERFVRIQSLLDSYISETDIGIDIVQEYITDNPRFLEDFIGKSPQLLEKIVPPEKIEKLNDEVVELELRIQGLNQQQQNQKKLVEQEKKRAQDEINKIQEDAEEKISEIKRKSQEEIKKESEIKVEKIQKEIEKQSDLLRQTKTELEEIREEHNLVSTYSDLELEIKVQERRLDNLRDAVKRQENTLKHPDLGGQLTEFKTLIDMLQGRTFNGESIDNFAFNPPKVIQNTPSRANAKEFVQTLVEYFDNDGYSWSFDQMSNFLINIQQNFFTVLAGPPGTGKTSSIIKLAKGQFLCEKKESISDCFLNVSVGRGWMTSRDTIGFYNSLKGVYQPSKTGIYEFLRKGESESAGEFLRMILLDEANLSPIEHYWSDFIAMCDDESRNKPIDTGMPDERKYLKVPENIRFIATINNDSSTEPLSPRLIDRVPVVIVGEEAARSASDIASWTIDGAVPYQFLENCFGRKNYEDEGIWAQSQIDEFCRLLSEKNNQRGNPVIVSNRKINNMYSYYNRAIDYMESNTAADYAISQQALPLISGHGSAFKERLKALKDYADDNSLIMTAGALDRIIKSGEEYIDSYSFF